MKKVIPIVLLFISIASIISCTNNDRKTDTQLLKLNDKVKYLEVCTYKAVEKGGKVEKGNLIAYKFIEYNEDGYMVSYIDNTLKSTFKYDSKGNKIELNRFNRNSELEYKTKFKTDSIGNIIEENLYKANKELESKTIYRYDSIGNKIEVNSFNKGGVLEYKITYLYDTKENITEENKYNSTGVLEYKTKYLYDSKENKIEENNYINGLLAKKTTYKYEFDQNSNWKKRTAYDKNNKVESITERKIFYFGSEDENLIIYGNIPIVI